jgi:radical SAM/Cys-rich protein
MKSLKAEHNRLSDAHAQIAQLETGIHENDPFRLVPFQQKLETIGMYPLRPTGVNILQINMGKMCNQVCAHCHVDAGPDRKEIMTKDIMNYCIDVIKNNEGITTVDLTGGAPEMNPDFIWFVEKIKETNPHVHIIVRCNLTIIVANKKYYGLPEFYKKHGLEVVSSLPFYTKDRTDRQRGNGVFEDSIKALKMLNDVGYGMEGSDLVLNLVYNPAGAFLPPSQVALEKEYKQSLHKDFGISFNSLFAITNLPISRYLDYLIKSGNYERYMEKLVAAFNPAAAVNVMCRNTVSVGWDGELYDCDFNQMLELKTDTAHQHISSFNIKELNGRNIVINQHCYGCTAGAGSSCGGAVT